MKRTNHVELCKLECVRKNPEKIFLKLSFVKLRVLSTLSETQYFKLRDIRHVGAL